MSLNNNPKTFNLGAGFKFKGGAPAGPSGVRIEHRVGIQAPPETIWEVLYDLPGWSKWNPLYVEAEGQIRIGSTLRLKMVLPGEAAQDIRPVVLEWVPHEQLHWRLSLMWGMVSNTRYIEIEKLGETSCIVSNGELFGGLFGPSVAKRLGRKVWKGFEAMDLALKEEAEARWRQAQGAPTSQS
ncbi:SRPBCC family protein [Phenylobacterium sp.]|uniref:SRPBCC family protein n=1 Tax=Phenylobacterium sp. TaxID=1871053 RepID=UPI0035B44842